MTKVLSCDPHAGRLCSQVVSDRDLTLTGFWKEQDSILSSVGFTEKSWAWVSTRTLSSARTQKRDNEGCAEEPDQPDLQPALRNELNI